MLGGFILQVQGMKMLGFMQAMYHKFLVQFKWQNAIENMSEFDSEWYHTCTYVCNSTYTHVYVAM